MPLPEQKWANDTFPLVSISCITYNHEAFIRDAIEAFLMQKTTFPVEILIHDDASTDGTPRIIREYEEKYPNLIFPIYQTENLYSQGTKISINFQYPRARGKYIAYCEGDDYWADPLKLQKQVDFLEANDEYSFCSHNFWVLNQETSEMVVNRLYTSDFEISLNDILLMKSKKRKFTIHMNSVTFRNYQDLADNPILMPKSKAEDY